MNASDLLATLRYWRECGIDRLSGERCGFLPAQAGASPPRVVLPVSPPRPVPSIPAPPPIVPAAQPAPPPVTLDRLLTEPVATGDKPALLEAMAREVGVCSRCPLSLTRHRPVFGAGSHDAPPVLLVGDFPKEEEEATGEPFGGEVRELLNGMLAACGWQRREVYLANVIKCRPPGDRQPRSEEVSQCQGHLFGQLEVVRPRVILALGKVAMDCLLGSGGQVGAVRGRAHVWRGIPVVVSYHPAFCLRTPASKRAVWEDLLFLMKILEKNAV
ncbi:MAG: uracil-DNA glycosylase [Magnetococcales bacterium]|nr:uracil-DNA glycosylase [Magnetococcales bacterium]